MPVAKLFSEVLNLLTQATDLQSSVVGVTRSMDLDAKDLCADAVTSHMVSDFVLPGHAPEMLNQAVASLSNLHATYKNGASEACSLARNAPSITCTVDGDPEQFNQQLRDHAKWQTRAKQLITSTLCDVEDVPMNLAEAQAISEEGLWVYQKCVEIKSSLGNMDEKCAISHLKAIQGRSPPIGYHDPLVTGHLQDCLRDVLQKKAVAKMQIIETQGVWNEISQAAIQELADIKHHMGTHSAFYTRFLEFWDSCLSPKILEIDGLTNVKTELENWKSCWDGFNEEHCSNISQRLRDDIAEHGWPECSFVKSVIEWQGNAHLDQAVEDLKRQYTTVQEKMIDSKVEQLLLPAVSKGQQGLDSSGDAHAQQWQQRCENARRIVTGGIACAKSSLDVRLAAEALCQIVKHQDPAQGKQYLKVLKESDAAPTQFKSVLTVLVDAVEASWNNDRNITVESTTHADAIANAAVRPSDANQGNSELAGVDAVMTNVTNLPAPGSAPEPQEDQHRFEANNLLISILQ